jgi:type I restriction enzyme M protein
LPDGFLFGEGVKTRIKERLLEECNLHTIVRLPNGVFSPYTDIQTNLLFFTKGEPTEEIWYFEHPFPEGYKKYTKTKPIRHEEFELEKAWWNDRIENEYAWKVSVNDIKKRNYNFDINNPSKKTQEMDKRTSGEIILDMIEKERNIFQLLNQVKENLAKGKIDD